MPRTAIQKFAFLNPGKFSQRAFRGMPFKAGRLGRSRYPLATPAGNRGLMRHEMIEHALGKGLERDAEAALVATSTVAAVRLLLRELKPLIGELAACALYRRSVHLARSSFQRAPDDAKTHDELLAPLHQDLSVRTSEEAQKGSRALLMSLVDLLVSLIGEPLTHRLLRKAWGIRADAQAPEEKPQ